MTGMCEGLNQLKYCRRKKKSKHVFIVFLLPHQSKDHFSETCHSTLHYSISAGLRSEPSFLQSPKQHIKPHL